MGLDTYASREPDRVVLTPEDEAVFKALDVRLCEWVGDGSFRGKLYVEVVHQVTGVSLVEDWIPPEEVPHMADAFERCDPGEIEASWEGYPSTLSADEIRWLRQVFRICADRGLGLIGWY